MTRRARDERGFTLIEMAFAIGVFGAVIIGLSFVFQGAFRTVNQVRYEDVARTLAQEKLEEIRSLPFFVPQNVDASDVDLLDRYYPDTAPPGYDGTSGVWAYTTAELIPRPDAPDFERTVTVQFVAPAGLAPRPPRDGYDSDVAGADEPATDAVKVVVGVTWSESGQEESVELDTVVARTSQEEPKVEASGSVLAAQISDLTFQDGDSPGIEARVVASVASGSVAFREVTGSTAQASSNPIQITELDPATNLDVQPGGPAGDEAATTVPNSTTGNTQSVVNGAAGNFYNSVNDPISVIAAWGETTAAADSRVSTLHVQNPEARAQAVATNVIVNARDIGAEAPHTVLQIAGATGTLEQRSVPTETTVASSVDLTGAGALPAVTIWGAPQFLGQPGFEGIVKIQSLHVDVTSSAGSTIADTIVNWTVEGLRVWDPNLPRDDGSSGGYVGPWTFGIRADCGAWVTDPNACGPSFSNPNPVVIPSAYADAAGNTSLGIVAGVTVDQSAANPGTGVSSATAGQKNILAISLRDDVTGAVPLEPSLIGLGDVNTSVSYIAHEH